MPPAMGFSRGWTWQWIGIGAMWCNGAVPRERQGASGEDLTAGFGPVAHRRRVLPDGLNGNSNRAHCRGVSCLTGACSRSMMRPFRTNSLAGPQISSEAGQRALVLTLLVRLEPGWDRLFVQ